MKKPTGFEGKANPMYAFFHGNEDEDDPTFLTLSQIAEQMKLALPSVQRRINQAPEMWEVRRVRRKGVPAPVKVYRFKGAP